MHVKQSSHVSNKRKVSFSVLFIVALKCISISISGARGSLVVMALRTNRQVAGSIPDCVIEIFQ